MRIKNKKQILTDHFELVIIELPKALKAYKKNKNDELLQWLMFLDNAKSEEVTQIMEKNEDIKEAKEELEKISQDDILRRRALSRTLDIADKIQFEKEATERGLKKGIKKGKIEGEKETKIAIVKKLHENNMTIEQIAQIVELEEGEINRILNEN